MITREEIDKLEEWNTNCYNQWKKEDEDLPYRIYVLIKFREYLENLTKHAEKSKDFLHQKGNSSSNKNCFRYRCKHRIWNITDTDNTCHNILCLNRKRSPS